MAHRHDEGTLASIFTMSELRLAAVARRRSETLAVCFAAKEAMAKALGCGMAGIDWTEVDCCLNGQQLHVQLTGKAEKRARGLGTQQVLASWTSLGPDLVLAFVVLS
jgi:holo-[acyl-carrier protein] synthase